jgi:hypothetical protein
MKAKDLIKKLQKLDPEIDVVRSSDDHGYESISGLASAEAEVFIRGRYHEYYGVENMTDKTARVVEVVVIE